MATLWDEDFVPFEATVKDSSPSTNRIHQHINYPVATKTEAQKYTLAGVDVRFPFPAYKNQLDMMEKVSSWYHGDL